MKIKCCRHCTERTARCHTYCKRYIEEKAIADEKRRKEYDINGYVSEMIAHQQGWDAKARQNRRRWHYKK